MKKNNYKKYICVICGWIYDENEGCKECNILPGTLWNDIPDTFECPDCGAKKIDFEMIEL